MRGRIPVLFCFLGILLLFGCTATFRPYTLSEVGENFQKYETSRFNPLSLQSRSIPVTNLLPYDEFFTKSSRSIVILQTAETVLESALGSLSRNESLTDELEVAEVLEKEIPVILESLPELEEKGNQLQKNLERDFSGRRQAQLPYVAKRLLETLEELKEYHTKAPRILEDLQRMRQDPESLSREDPELSDKRKQYETEPVLQPEDNTSMETKAPSDLKPESTPDGLPLREPEREEMPTNEAREYSKKLKEGLLDVFRAESSKNVKTLSRLTLHHPIPRVRAAGASALGRLKQGRKALETAIRTDAYVVRPEAYKALAEMGHKASLPVFFAGVRSEDPEIQAASFLGIGKTKDPVGRGLILSRGLSSTNETILSYSLKGIAYYQIPSDLDLISKYLGSDSKRLNQAAIDALLIHATPESFLILQNSLTEYPNLTLPILEAIGRNQGLASTLFLVRASQLYENEEVRRKIDSLLLQRKAFGTYGMVVVNEDRIRISPNERSKATGIVRLGDVGKVNAKGTKRFVIRIGEGLAEDVYYNLTFENRSIGTRNRYSRGWIFGKKIRRIQIDPPSKTAPATL